MEGEDTISRKSTGPLTEGKVWGDQSNKVDMRHEYLGPREEALVRRIEELEMTLSSKRQHALDRSFDWLRCKPDQHYHSKWQIQSLEVFEPMVRGLATRKKIAKYLHERDELTIAPGAPTPTPKQIRTPIIFEDIRLLNAYHLYLTDDSKFILQSKTSIPPPPGSPHGTLLLSLDKSVRSTFLCVIQSLAFLMNESLWISAQDTASCMSQELYPISSPLISY